ncbi:Eukaryotic translation initiation factor 5B [Camellia lanceoleosa]|uniref:Eukaryotic translation initiation factor 5B n=1 Tax=Camellia lanceoleosa TaxID=1840588 RepID=A0ACC0IGN1_9ERIC|nr:Eukaryotic translation initiation factor 5B [Camellia lanceoleosa]
MTLFKNTKTREAHGIGNSAYNTIGYPPTQSHVNFDGRAMNETTAKLHNSSAPHGSQNVTSCPTLFVANLGPSCSEEELIQGPIVTSIRALLTPHPMKELRVKGAYLHHKEIKATQGIKITTQAVQHPNPN